MQEDIDACSLEVLLDATPGPGRGGHANEVAGSVGHVPGLVPIAALVLTLPGLLLVVPSYRIAVYVLHFI